MTNEFSNIFNWFHTWSIFLKSRRSHNKTQYQYWLLGQKVNQNYMIKAEQVFLQD